MMSRFRKICRRISRGIEGSDADIGDPFREMSVYVGGESITNIILRNTFEVGWGGYKIASSPGIPFDVPRNFPQSRVGSKHLEQVISDLSNHMETSGGHPWRWSKCFSLEDPKNIDSPDGNPDVTSSNLPRVGDTQRY